jgi:iron(III) transport system permease protein
VTGGHGSARTATWLGVGLLAYFAFALFLPVWSVVASGFRTVDGQWTLQYAALILRDPVLLRGLLNATWIAVCTTGCALLLAIPLAVLCTRYEFPGRRWLNGLVLLPLILPPFVGALGVRLLLSRFGPLTQLFAPDAPTGVDWLGTVRTFGVIVTEALALYPIVFLNVQAALANIDPAYERAARNLGATRWQVFTRVTLPLVKPGIFAGGTLVMIWSFTELGTPLMFQLNEVTPVQIFSRLSELDSPIPHALVTVMLLASTLLYAVGKWVLGKQANHAASKSAQATSVRPLSGFMRYLAPLAVVAVVALSALPHTAVILTSVSEPGAWYHSVLPQQWTLAHYQQALSDPLIMPRLDSARPSLGAIGNSLLYATLATLLGGTIALIAAHVIVRSKLRWRGLLDVLCMLPLAVPGLVLAFGYLSISVSMKHALGTAMPAALDVQRWPIALLVCAYAARRLPYIVRSAVAGLQQTPVVLEQAASNLGAGRLRTLWRITLPLIFAQLLAGALLAFTFSLLEVSDSLLLAQTTEAYPITKAIWELGQRLGDGAYVASALGAWAMLLLGTCLLATSALLGKKLGAMFRV